MADAATTNAVPPKRAAKFDENSVIKFGKDSEGKVYGPQPDGSFYNAKRAGSGASARFAKMKDGMTVKEALESGVTRADLNWDSKQGFVVIK